MNTSNIWRKLRNKKYRDAFVASQLKRGMPFQISAMRKKLDWSQEELAKASGVTQGVISRAENPNYGNLTFNTVLRIAAGFDVAFVGWFVPFSKLTEWYENLSEESVQAETFEEENKKRTDNRDEPAAHAHETNLLNDFLQADMVPPTTTEETQRQASAAELATSSSESSESKKSAQTITDDPPSGESSLEAWAA